MNPSSPDVTQLILSWKGGDKNALDQITGLLYDELRRLAAANLRRERTGHTLQPTALVNEAWMRMAGLRGMEWKDRAHFLGIAAHVMRQVLIQHARSRNASKRGGLECKVTMVDPAEARGEQVENLLTLDEALTALAAFDERKARMVEMRYFAGMQSEEIAEATGSSTATVGRQLRMAQAWLHRFVAGATENEIPEQ
ncbi:MAG: sigma-70 family RNA polymerase sigma factor [Bryobacteraceae bacterium]|nr:sigma-70 family RNA polymerase sigma factor [Bryobacteraceae bacterium]